MKIKEIWKNVSDKVSDFVCDHQSGIVIVVCGIIGGLTTKVGYDLGKYETCEKTYELLANDTIGNPDLTVKDFMKNNGLIK